MLIIAFNCWQLETCEFNNLVVGIKLSWGKRFRKKTQKYFKEKKMN